MKRIFCLLLPFLLIFTACGSSAVSSSVSSVSISDFSGSFTDDTSAYPVPFDDSSVSDAAPSAEPSPIETFANISPSPSPDPAASIEETVLVDESGVKITATALDLDGASGPELKLLVENNTDIDLIVQIECAAINGYMVDSIASIDVSSGKKVNDEVTFMRRSLNACGIDTIACISISFRAFNWDSGPYFTSDIISLPTSAYGYQQAYDDSGALVYDANGVKIVSKGVSAAPSVSGPSICVYIENNTDEIITVQTRDESVDGYTVSAICSIDVAPGMRALDDIVFMQSYMDNNGLTSLNNVELSFYIFSVDGTKIDESAPTLILGGGSSLPEESAPIAVSDSELESVPTFNESEISNLKNMLDRSLSDAFGSDNCSVSVAGSTIEGKCWGSSLTLCAISASAGLPSYVEQWDELRSTLVDLCSAIQGVSDALHPDEFSIAISVVNDSNHDARLLTAEHGEIVYDFTAE